jgi:hypothetical protein
MNDFFQFKIETRTWHQIKSSGQVPSPRYFHASVAYGGSLYLFGGYSGQERLNDLYEYRFDIQTWFLVQTEWTPSGRSSLVAEVYKNSLFIFGGYNGAIVLNDFYEFKFEPVAIPPSTLVEDLGSLLGSAEMSDVVFVMDNGARVTANKSLVGRVFVFLTSGVFSARLPVSVLSSHVLQRHDRVVEG